MIIAYDDFFAFLASKFAGDHAISNPLAVVISIYLLLGALATVFFYRKQLAAILGRIPYLKNLVFFVPAKQFFYTGYVFIYLMLFTLIIEKGAETLEVCISVFLLFYAYNLMIRTKRAAQANPESTAPNLVRESSQ